jgi:C4-type Zn-finger protein
MARVRKWQRDLIALAETNQECPSCHQTWNCTEFLEDGRYALETRVKCRSCRDELRQNRKLKATPTDNEVFALRHSHMSDGGHNGSRRFASQVPQVR